MEKAMRKGSTSDPSTSTQDPSSMSLETFSELPEALGAFPPSDEVIVNLVDVYFRLLQNSFFNFLHEGLFTNQLQEQRIPKPLLYAMCAASAKSSRIFSTNARFQDPDSENGQDLARQFLAEANRAIISEGPSLELVQTHLLLSIANYSLGNGRKSWHELGNPFSLPSLTPGSAILLAFEMELHREPPLQSRPVISLMERELRRRCFWTCYILDRFLVCGSMRPMLIRDKDIKLRLPSTQDSFVAGHPIEGPFFSPTTFRSSTPGLGPISAEMSFIGIVSILGRATSYLQRGGVKGDTHFPWHSNSELASLRTGLATWYASVPQRYQSTGGVVNQSDASMTLLTMNCYHLIHCLIFRDFLPVDYQRESNSTTTTAVNRTWQSETAEACISSANEIGNILQVTQNTPGTNVPPVIG